MAVGATVGVVVGAVDAAADGMGEAAVCTAVSVFVSVSISAAAARMARSVLAPEANCHTAIAAQTQAYNTSRTVPTVRRLLFLLSKHITSFRVCF